MPDEPTINDYLDLLRVPLGRAVERAHRAFEEELNASSQTGRGGNTIRRVLDRLQQEFETSVTAALASLKRVQETTALNRSDMRQLTAQELEIFARQMKATVQIARFGQVPAAARALIEKELADYDDYLRLALRQFDVGLLDVPQPPPLGVSATATAAGEADRPPRPPSQPDPSHWAQGSNYDDAALSAASRRNLGAAVESAAGTTTPALPLSNSNAVITPAEPTAGTASMSVSLEGRTRVAAHAAGALGVNVAANTTNAAVANTTPDDLSPRSFFRENAERAEALATALSTTIKQEIARLKDERRNDPERQTDIDFLEIVAATLDEIATTISEARRAATPEDREQKFAKAESLARSLADAGRNFAQRNYERVLDYGGYSLMTVLGTQLFAMMFGLPYEVALATQLLLLGLTGPKKH